LLEGKDLDENWLVNMIEHVKTLFGKKVTKFNNHGEILSSLYKAYLNSPERIPKLLNDLGFLNRHLKQYQLDKIRRQFSSLNITKDHRKAAIECMQLLNNVYD